MLLGVNGKVYYLTTGTRATWGAATNGIHSGAAPGSITEISSVGDVKIPDNDTEVEVKIRRLGGFKGYGNGLTELAPEFDILYEPAAADYIALEKARATKTSIAIAILDGDKATAGTKGFWADWLVLGFEKNEPIDNVQTVSVKLKPSAGSAVPPERVIVA